MSWLVNCQLKEPIAPTAIADPLHVTAAEKAEQLATDQKILFSEFGIKKKGGE